MPVHVRVVAVLTAVVAMIVIPAAASSAAVNPRWSGSRFTQPAAGEAVTTAGPVRVVVEFRHDFLEPEGRIDVRRVDVPAGCGAPSLSPPTEARRTSDDNRRVLVLTSHATFPCNGVYELVARACVDTLTSSCDIQEQDEVPAEPVASETRVDLRRVVEVAAPPGSVPGVAAAPEGRDAIVTWEELPDAPTDFAGYLIERASGDGEFAELIRAEPGTHGVSDPIDAAGGEYRWRVRALRHAPGGEVATPADAAEPVALTFEAVPSSGPTTSSPGRGSRPTVQGPVFRSPRYDGPAGTGTSPGTRTPSTLDTGYEEALPYDIEPGDADAVLPDDGFGVDYGGSPGGLLVPGAAALALAVWAAHFRYLNGVVKRIP
jgi:hypothetical protein